MSSLQHFALFNSYDCTLRSLSISVQPKLCFPSSPLPFHPCIWPLPVGFWCTSPWEVVRTGVNVHLWMAADRKARKYNDARCGEVPPLSCEAVTRRPTCWFSLFLIGVFSTLRLPTGSVLCLVQVVGGRKWEAGERDEKEGLKAEKSSGWLEEEMSRWNGCMGNRR